MDAFIHGVGVLALIVVGAAVFCGVVWVVASVADLKWDVSRHSIRLSELEKRSE